MDLSIAISEDQMNIEFFEVCNFRKLKSIRIDVSKETTLLVGANNSGKTSAMVALGHFLVNPNRITTNDFTLSNWTTINGIGVTWENLESAKNPQKPTLDAWETVLPSLDIWLNVRKEELFYVRALLPTLDWDGGLLGVRLRLEPKAIDELYEEYLTAINSAKEIKMAWNKDNPKAAEYTLKLWPHNMRAFLDRKLASTFTIRAYLLDPANHRIPVNGIAQPQSLPGGSAPHDSNPLDGLIRVDVVAAQRGLGDSGSNRGDSDGDDTRIPPDKRKLSEQLRSYYSRHLDPSDYPDPSDLDALAAIEDAHKLFDERLEIGFSPAFEELSGLNYPGITDPRLKIATRMRPTDGLDHNAALQYEVLPGNNALGTGSVTLPEEYNGLGYQNLISIVFKLMSFRDAWMRVGKAGRVDQQASAKPYFRPPLHLVLVEEPEAYLHVQVQQVFVRKAYAVLRNNPELEKKPTLQTQLIVSTHSSHVAHEPPFSCLRYFRRVPGTADEPVPTAAVINLSEVFGNDNETQRFVTRYLRAFHCDLFFADAAILVEGSGERILIPHFISQHFPDLNSCFVTLLEIGGSHAHRFRPLIEHLGLTTLIITDLDSVEETGHHRAVAPKRGCNQISGSTTLKDWHPKTNKLDDLLGLNASDKVKTNPDVPFFSIRVAYQIPCNVACKEDSTPAEALARTFEDSLALENLSLFRDLEGEGMIALFRNAIRNSSEPVALGAAIFAAMRDREKAVFALDLLSLEAPKELKIPEYINEGLLWLEGQLKRKHESLLVPNTTPIPEGAK
jgi:predicted ATP-dependent endonuclease of OLD family